MNNDEYNHIEIIRGRQYRYDPDYDCYYSVPVKLSRFDQWAWIVTIAVLAGLSFYLEFVR